MLRITVTREEKTALMKLEGSIRGPWVIELEEAWRQMTSSLVAGQIQVELSGVSFADYSGRKILSEIKNAGAILTGASTFLQHLLDEKTTGSAGDVPDQREN